MPYRSRGEGWVLPRGELQPPGVTAQPVIAIPDLRRLADPEEMQQRCLCLIANGFQSTLCKGSDFSWQP